MKLFRITTKGLGDFYVVAESLNEAEDKCADSLSRSDYGIANHRKLISIVVITSEVGVYGVHNLPNITDDNRLIL